MPEDEETKDDASKGQQKSRKETIFQQMRQKLTTEEEEMKVAHVYELKRRACSLDSPMRKGGLYTKYRLLEESENWDNKVIAFEHPLRSYQTYLSSFYGGFPKLQSLQGDELESRLAKVKAHVKTHMRVRSQQATYRQSVASQELKPLGA